MKRNKHKLVFVGLYDEKNLGDPIIAHCTEWLYSGCLPDGFGIERLCLDYIEHHGLSLSHRIVRKMLRLLRLDSDKYNDAAMQEEYTRYFKEHIEGADLIIVVGGGLIKYSYQYFFAGISGLLDAADLYGIPVVFNAIGIEGYDAANPRCVRLKSALHKRALRHITTRDDIEALRNCYFDGSPSIPCLKVADPAVWAAEAYGVTKKESILVGIGIGREGLFMDNGKDYSGERFFAFYYHIVEELSKQGVPVELFTNGSEADNKFARRICEALKERKIIVRLRIPQIPEDMLEIISSYCCILAARLHSCIVAYSLDIPAIGFVWNDKLKLWGKNIGAAEFFIEAENMDVDFVMKQFARIQHYRYPKEQRDAFRGTIKSTIDELVTKYIKPYNNMLIDIKSGGGKSKVDLWIEASQSIL